MTDDYHLAIANISQNRSPGGGETMTDRSVRRGGHFTPAQSDNCGVSRLLLCVYGDFYRRVSVILYGAGRGSGVGLEIADD